MPIHKDLWNFYKQNECETPLDKAVRFLFLSNFGYMGKTETLSFLLNNTKQQILKNIDKTFDFIFDIRFNNVDF